MVHQLPEGGAVIVVLQVRKFVENDVILHKRRRHDEPPCQHDPTGRRAASPTGKSVSYDNTRRQQSGCFRKSRHPLTELPAGHPLKKILNATREEVDVSTDIQERAIDPRATMPVRGMINGVRNAIDRDGAPCREIQLDGAALKLPGNPVAMGGEKSEA